MGVPQPPADSTELTTVVTRLRRALRRSIRSEYPWELRPAAQLEVLQTMTDDRSWRVGDLAERLRLAQSTVSALIGKLVDAGLLSRDVDPVDRRASLVALTTAGRGELRQWDAAHRKRIDHALNELSARDRATVLAAVGAIGRLVDALEAADDGRALEASRDAVIGVGTQGADD
jgi:DNA-binding MarR family transcriptional regulator